MSQNLDLRMYPSHLATSAVMTPSPPQPDWMAELLGVPTCCCRIPTGCVCNVPCQAMPLPVKYPANLKSEGFRLK